MRAKIIDIAETDMYYSTKERYIGRTGDFEPDDGPGGNFKFDGEDMHYYFVNIKVELLPEIDNMGVMLDTMPPSAFIALSEGTKHDVGKLRLDLIPPEVEGALGEILTYGAKKYEDRNWEKGIKYSRIYGALRRHLLAWLAGEKLDGESGKPHLWHALTCLAFLVTYEERRMDIFDDLHTSIREEKHE